MMASLGIIDVVAVNLQCFGLIIVGYFARKFNLLDNGQTKGLNVFISYYALPALVFYSISTISLHQVNLGFVGQIFISKALIFFFVGLITFILSYKSLTLPLVMKRCSIFAMFCTQSNDFALGYPILLSLYGNTKTSLANYLYILAPIQLLILNPIGLFLFEISKIIEETHSSPSIVHRFMSLTKRLIKKIFINPIILSTILGLIVNLSTKNSLPKVVMPFLQSLSQSFSPIALFLLGLNIHGNFKSLKMFSQPLLITLVLVLTKLFIMPLLNRAIVEHLEMTHNSIHNETFSQFAFLYGTFPAAPTVYIFSTMYSVETLIVSAGLVISTLLSAPIIFVSTNMIRFSSQINYNLLNNDLRETIFYCSLISLIGSVLLTCNFYITYKFRSIIHRWSFLILCSHILILIGGILFKFNNASQFSFYEIISTIQYFLFNLGFFLLKFSISFLSLTLIFLYAKSLCFVIKISKIFFYCTLISLISFTLLVSFTYEKTLEQSGFLIDLYYGINRIHLSLSIIMSCLTIVISLISFILLHHFKNKVQYGNIPEIINDTNEDQDDEFIPQQSSSFNLPTNVLSMDVEDLYMNLPRKNVFNEDFNEKCNSACHSQCNNMSKNCSSRLVKYVINVETAVNAFDMIPSPDESNDFHQIQQHMYSVMFSILIIIVHLSIEVNHFIQDKPNGIYVEIKFLDILLVFTHGFLMFLLFGINAKVIAYKLNTILKLFR